MARFFLRNGEYFETITEVEPDGDGTWVDGRTPVVQRPSGDHVWQGNGWVHVPNPAKAAAEAKLAAARAEIAKPMPSDLNGVMQRLVAIETILGIGVAGS